MRPRISIRGCVRPSIRPFVRPSIRLSVRPSFRPPVGHALLKEHKVKEIQGNPSKFNKIQQRVSALDISSWIFLNNFTFRAFFRFLVLLLSVSAICREEGNILSKLPSV